MPKILLSLTVAMLAIAAAAPPETMLPGETPEVVARWVEHMRGNMELGRYPDGRPLERETAAERAKPIMAPDLAKRVFDRGKLSGEIEACGGDWKAMSLDPLMAELQARGDLMPKQLGFAALLHGAAQDGTNDRLEEECTPEHKQAIERTLRASMSQKG